MKKFLSYSLILLVVAVHSVSVGSEQPLTLSQRKSLFSGGNLQQRPLAPASAVSGNIKLEISNQSDSAIGAFVDATYGQEGLAIPFVISGLQDMPGMQITKSGRVFITTPAGIYQLGPDQGQRTNIELIQFKALPENLPGKMEKRLVHTTLKSIPYNDLSDLVIIVNPDGTVTFAKRNI